MDDFIQEASLLDKFCIGIQRAGDITARKFVARRAKEWVERHRQHTSASASDWFFIWRRWSNRHDLRFLNGRWLFLSHLHRYIWLKCRQWLWFRRDRLRSNGLFLFLGLPTWHRSRFWCRWLSLGYFDRFGGLPVCCACWLNPRGLSHHFACLVAQPCGQIILLGRCRLLCL